MDQQTVLRVQTNNKTEVTTQGTGSLYIDPYQIPIPEGISWGGDGSALVPLTGITITGGPTDGDVIPNVQVTVTGDAGILNYQFKSATTGFTGTSYVSLSIERASGFNSGVGNFAEYGINNCIGKFNVYPGDVIYMNASWDNMTGNTFSLYVDPFNVPVTTEPNQYENLDLYGEVPIKINKSFAELEDISKRNSDFSIGLTLPGSKKNNRFFENYFNVDAQSLFFDVTKRVMCDVLLNDEKYFTGYLKLNKVKVMNSAIEYDVTLYSVVGDLFGKIGNNLLKDLNFNSIDYRFNHYFTIWNTVNAWNFSNLQSVQSAPPLYFYPIVHNGYNYINVSGDTQVNLVGDINEATRLYNSTIVGSYVDFAAFDAAGGLEGRVNSPAKPLLDNQLKPALNIWGLIQLMFAQYGYTIKSDFFNTPWFKLLYLYGYYSSTKTKFSYDIGSIPSYGYDQVQLHLTTTPAKGGKPLQAHFIIINKETKEPCFCTGTVTWNATKALCDNTYIPITGTIFPNTSGNTINLATCGGGGFPGTEAIVGEPITSPEVSTWSAYSPIPYFPLPPNTIVNFKEGDDVDFSFVIDKTFKQIDLLSSIAKKFSLVFVPDPDVANQIIIEPYDYYIGTGDVKDWTDKLSFDTGFTVEPALNYIESEIIISDLEDGDDGNKLFKDANNRIYGRAKVVNPTNFKSQTKTIETIFSPEVIRKWDENIGMPLGINYTASNGSVKVGNTERVTWEYKGLKSKSKLMYNLGNFSPFLDQLGESYTFTGSSVNTMLVRTQKSNGTNPNGSPYGLPSVSNPIISHTMPIGNPDSNKNGRGFENDSICNLFNSELPADFGLGQPSYNVYTDNDLYNIFYSDRITNIFNPNSRFLSGNFYLKLSDVQNLKPNDLIKINEQYFTWNKIDGYNLTNTELTKVELIQTNVQPNTYPTRYFKYQYCGDSNVYKFRTYFNPEENPTFDGIKPNAIGATYFYWSVLYDYFVGILGGSVSGYTSSYGYLSNYPTDERYARFAYTINEIDEIEYNTITLDHTNDPNDDYFINFKDEAQYNNISYSITNQNPNLWVFSNQTGNIGSKAFFNIAPNCTTFSGYCATNLVTISPPPTPL